MKGRLLSAALAAAALLAALPPSAAAETPAAVTYDGFGELRHAVLERIAGATQRVWLTTEYLTDGEIVTALYLAHYRKLDVKVLLGRAKASHYMSRLGYLKAQNVPVFLRPDQFRADKPTALLADDALLLIDGELDSGARHRKFAVTRVGGEGAQRYLAGFAEAARLEIPAVPRPLPLVGRPGARPSGGGDGRAYNKGTSLPDGSYRYDRRAEPRPDGVPASLPKVTKTEERRRQQQSGPALPAETTVP